MTEKDKKGGERMLVLGFDAGCGTCRDIASRVKERLGDALTVRNLSDPEVMNWREEALGPEAPWAPTLFEVEGKSVRAWTGKKMALPLSRKLGLSRTWQLMQALGDMPNSGIQTVENPSVGMSRGSFLKGVGGAAVAMSVLSGAGPLASVALAARAPQPYDIVKAVAVTGSQRKASIRHSRLSADARTLIGNALSTDARVAASNPATSLLTLRNGTLIQAVSFHLPNNRVLYKYTSTRPLVRPLGTGTSLAKLYIERDDTQRSRTLYSASEMGMIWRRPQSESGSRTTAASSELGGCPPVQAEAGPGGHSSQQYTTYECASYNFAVCGFGSAATYQTCRSLVPLLAAGPKGLISYAAGCGGSLGLTLTGCCTSWRKVCRPIPNSAI